MRVEPTSDNLPLSAGISWTTRLITRRLFAAILVAQTSCVAVGLIFHHLLLTRMGNGEQVGSALPGDAMWEASGITLLWTGGLLAVTLFMTLTHFKHGQSASRVHPEVEALKQAQALLRTQETVIFGLAKLSDSRDSETGSHLERIAQFSSMLAAGLRSCPSSATALRPASCN